MAENHSNGSANTLLDDTKPADISKSEPDSNTISATVAQTDSPKQQERQENEEPNTDDKMDIDDPEKAITSSADSSLQLTQSRPSTVDAVIDAQLIETPNPLVNLSQVYETSPVEVAEWSPVSPLTLAMTSSELTATLLTFPSTISENVEPTSAIRLQHSPVEGAFEKTVTALSWNSVGTLVVTATFDGQMRLWTAEGKLRHILPLHRAPVLVIRWNKPNTLIMSVDCTNTVVIWDAYSGDIRQTFQHLNTNTLKYEEGVVNGIGDATGNLSGGVVSVGTDADWIDSLTYATTGDNASIMIYKISERGPLLRFRGHTQGINTLQFDPKTQLLASGSDDHTIRIWHGKAATAVMTLTGHLGPVICTRWLPSTGIISALDPAAFGGARLASASLDGTLRVWDPNKGVCLAVLSLHEAPIFTCEVSPDGKFLASGGLDGVLLVWDISEIKDIERSAILASQDPTKKLTDISGAIHSVARFELKSTEGDQKHELSKLDDGNEAEVEASKRSSSNEQINSISWNADGTKLFVGFSSKSVVVDTTSLSQVS